MIWQLEPTLIDAEAEKTFLRIEHAVNMASAETNKRPCKICSGTGRVSISYGRTMLCLPCSGKGVRP